MNRARYAARVFLMGVVLAFAYFFRLMGLFEPMTIAILAIVFGGVSGALAWKALTNYFVKIPPDFALIVKYEFCDGGPPIVRRLARGSRGALETLQRRLPIVPYEGPRPHPTAVMSVVPWDVWECDQYE